MNRQAFLGDLIELVEDGLYLGARHGFKQSHRMAQFLYLTRPKVLEHFGGAILTKRYQQCSAFFHAIFGASCHLGPSSL